MRALSATCSCQSVFIAVCVFDLVRVMSSLLLLLFHKILVMGSHSTKKNKTGKENCRRRDLRGRYLISQETTDKILLVVAPMI